MSGKLGRETFSAAAYIDLLKVWESAKHRHNVGCDVEPDFGEGASHSDLFVIIDLSYTIFMLCTNISSLPGVQISSKDKDFR